MELLPRRRSAGRGALRDERSSPLLAAYEALRLESRIDRAGRVHVHAGDVRELAHAWQSLTRAENAVRNRSPDTAGELCTKRGAAAAIDAEFELARHASHRTD